MFPYQHYNVDEELLDCLEIIYNLIDFLDDIRLARTLSMGRARVGPDFSWPGLACIGSRAKSDESILQERELTGRQRQ